MKKLTILMSLVSATYLSGCAVTTASVAGDERRVVRSMDDVSAAQAIKARMLRNPEFALQNVDVEVAEGIVVLSGTTAHDQDRLEAERIAWSAPNIKKVGNEIAVSHKPGLDRITADGILNSAIRTRLIADPSVRSINYNIEAHDGIVYLLGVARTSQELERVATIASTTKGAEEVISYIKLADDELTDDGQLKRRSGQGVQNNIYAYDEPYSYDPYSASPDSDAFIPFQGPTQSETLEWDQGGSQAQPMAESAPVPDNASEPYFRDPVTGERIILPPGTVTVPFDPQRHGNGAGGSDEPFYINQDTGEKVMIVYRPHDNRAHTWP